VNVNVNVSIVFSLHGDTIRGSTRVYGHLYLGSIALPTFVAAEPMKYPDAIVTAMEKLGRAMTKSLGAVTGKPAKYVQTTVKA